MWSVADQTLSSAAGWLLKRLGMSGLCNMISAVECPSGSCVWSASLATGRTCLGARSGRESRVKLDQAGSEVCASAALQDTNSLWNKEQAARRLEACQHRIHGAPWMRQTAHGCGSQPEPLGLLVWRRPGTDTPPPESPEDLFSVGKALGLGPTSSSHPCNVSGA